MTRRRHDDASAARRKMKRPQSSVLRTTLLIVSFFTTDTHCWSTLITLNSSPQHQNRDPQPVKNQNLTIEEEIRRNMPLHANETYKQFLRNKHQSLFLAPSPNAKPDSALKSFISGGIGGFCAVIVGHPFDLVKVKIQTGGPSMANASVLGMLRKMFVSQGFGGIYRGVSAPIVAVTPMFAVSFWGYDMGKKIVRNADGEYKGDAGAYQFSISQLCVAGALSSIPTTAIMAPSERLKCLMQIHPERYGGLMDCAKQVYAEGGIKSVFRGTGATLLRDIPGGVMFFGAYELMKKKLMEFQNIDPKSGALSPISVLCAGGFAGMAMWAVVIPVDVLKSRFQIAPPGTYNGIGEVYRELMLKEGPSALISGMRPALIRAFPANAACFLGMEVSKQFLGFLD